MAILAIDQGTTSTRALRVEADGRAVITHAIRHRQYYPATGRVEHDPAELLQNIRRCIEDNPRITAIGIDNQGESCLAWHADTKAPLCPVIVWQDNRTHAAVERLETGGAGSLVIERACLPMDSYFSASKLAWILENVEDAGALHRAGKLRMGTTDAWFLDCLADRFVTDITTASRTSLMNLQSGHWDMELCHLFGVPPDVLPQIVPTTGELGYVESNGVNVPITASVVDQQASLYGHGCRRAGDAKITFGTGAFALSLTGPTLHRAPELGLLPTVAWQRAGERPVYALDGGVYCAGAAIEWTRQLGLFDDYESINRFDADSAISRDLVFVPALTGLACPHWDRRAGGLWLGMTPGTSKSDMMQSVIEGVAFRAAEVLRAMSRFTDVAEAVSIDGGVSVNPYFCQFLADVGGKRIAVKAFPELTALGTAALAGAPMVVAGDDDETTVHYEPRTDMSQYIVRFGEAVERAMTWRLG